MLLPPSVPGALVNFAALLVGKVPVNLNYTVSEETLASCIRQCGIKTVLTSQSVPGQGEAQGAGRDGAFWKTSRGPGRERRAGEKLASPSCMSVALSAGRRCARNARSGARSRVELDDLATVIFSSGSTGEPKGVMLSHYNIGSNIEQLEQVFGLDRQRPLPGRPAVLPFVRLHGHAVPAGGAGRRRGLSSQPARRQSHRPARQPVRA